MKFERSADQAVFENYLLAVEQQEARRATLDEQLEEVCKTAPYRKPVGILRCFRAESRGLEIVTSGAC